MKNANNAFARGSIGLVINAITSVTLVVASGCGTVPVLGEDAGSDATAPDAATCEPDTTQCIADTETICGSDGFVQASKSCPFGCSDSGTTCADIVPSNSMGQYLHDAESGPALELPAGTVIQTAAGTVLVNNALVTVPNVLVEAPLSGVEVRVFKVASLKVTGAISIEGTPAVAFVSAGDIVIQGGRLGVDANDRQSGPGAGPDGNGAAGVCVPNACQGDGGGGFGAGGGNGGGVGSSTGGTRGLAVGNETLVPLRGGGRSAATSGGGGGSMQLVSRTNITITGGGVVSAGGGGYMFNQVGGGGAGGGLLLEAPLVLVSGAGSAVAANGGGGGCIAPSQAAENGRLDAQRARGCTSSDTSANGAGGAGGAGAANSSGISGSAGSVNGGGGGGGVGRIRVNTRSGSFTVAAGAIVSPQASVGTLPIR